MPTTRSTIKSRSTQGRNNQQEDEVIEGAATPTATPASTTFKASLQRFQYGGTTSPVHSQTRRSSTRTSINAIKRETSPTNRSPPPAQPTSVSRKRLQTPTTTTPKKRKRNASKYAPPSTYAHLDPLTDILAPNLICVFVGTNPGIRTSTSGHAYAHPSNMFWKLLHSSGCTDRRCSPSEDVDLPRLYSMGNTNIVARPTRDAGELSKEEMTAGAGVLDEKIARWKPEAVCIVGKGIWEAIWRWKHGRGIRKEEFRWGWQDVGENMGVGRGGNGEGEGEWKGSKVFVATSTSGLSASLRPPEKEAIWRPFGEWVAKRRVERAAASV